MVLAAVGQICSTSSLTANLAFCQILIRKAVSVGAKALFLPEAADYIAHSKEEGLEICQPASESPFVLGLQDAARKHELPINVGIHEPTHPPSNRVKNTLIWIDAKGQIAHRYQKLHMMNIDLSHKGGPKLRESDSTEPGPRMEEPYTPVDGLHKVGSLICFDVRFPEPGLHLRRKGAKTLLYPSAFTVPTGKIHWETLLRARAIETQCWVIAAAQCGRHNEKRVSYGDSVVIDPRGLVVKRLAKVENESDEKEGGREPQLMTVDIDIGAVDEIRGEMDLLRRTDVYPEI